MANKPSANNDRKTKVFAYGAKEVTSDTSGYYHAKVTSLVTIGGYHAKFLATSGDHGSLLSWNTSLELNLLQPGNVVNTCN